MKSGTVTHIGPPAQLKFQTFRNTTWRTAAILKNLKMVIYRKRFDWLAWNLSRLSILYWPTKPCRQLRFRTLKIQDGGRPPFEKSKKWQYLETGLTDRHEIWHGDAYTKCCNIAVKSGVGVRYMCVIVQAVFCVVCCNYCETCCL